jgi:hypothetical protein
VVSEVRTQITKRVVLTFDQGPEGWKVPILELRNFVDQLDEVEAEVHHVVTISAEDGAMVYHASSTVDT